MKRTKRTLTLRGMDQFPVSTSFSSGTFNVLDYANVLDISMGWKVRGIEVMIQNPNLGSGFAREKLSVEVICATDDIVQGWAGEDTQVDFGDNRQIAWANQLYDTGMVPNSQLCGPVDSQVIVDPDHVIQNRLDLLFRVLGDASAVEGDLVRLNWIVYLDEYNITPSESIVFNIKQSAQDI